jgi:hypothetical protein
MLKYAMVMLVAGVVSLVPVAASGQTPALQGVMREKLAHSQQLLDAVVTSRWAALEQHAVALRAVTKRPAWAVLQSPEYDRQTARFDGALDDLIAAARRKDLDEAPLAYAAVTISCVQCHRHVARMRLAGASAPAAVPAP